MPPGADLPAVADFALLRVATIPYEKLGCLVLPETQECLRAVRLADVRLRESRVEVEERLYRLVPHAPSRLRRHILDVRRAVHGQREPAGQACHRVKEWLCGGEDRPLVKLLDEWQRLRAQRGQALAEAERTLERELQQRLRPRLVAAVREVFPLTPLGIIDYLQLRRPIYRKTAAYGHFGREDDDFVWERTHRAADLRTACGM